jgi:SAM-dependent methyltransferase
MKPDLLTRLKSLNNVLSNPTLYYYVRQILLMGLPFESYLRLSGLDDCRERVADLGCGPADILRYLSSKRHPQYYLGVDLSERYLAVAQRRAAAAGLDARFVQMNLADIPREAVVRDSLSRLLEDERISRVLLLGVIHHIDDTSVLETLDVLHGVPTIRRVVTWDAVLLPGNPINNLYSWLDRGLHIRHESEYDALVARSQWRIHDKVWTSPGIRWLRHLHYILER